MTGVQVGFKAIFWIMRFAQVQRSASDEGEYSHSGASSPLDMFINRFWAIPEAIFLRQGGSGKAIFGFCPEFAAGFHLLKIR